MTDRVEISRAERDALASLAGACASLRQGLAAARTRGARSIDIDDLDHMLTSELAKVNAAREGVPVFEESPAWEGVDIDLRTQVVSALSLAPDGCTRPPNVSPEGWAAWERAWEAAIDYLSRPGVLKDVSVTLQGRG